MLQFDWDENKNISNIDKHYVSFAEAAFVFQDPLSATFPDPDHSLEEDRYLTIGMSALDRVLIVSPTDRDDRIRIISARLATRHERRAYENGP